MSSCLSRATAEYGLVKTLLPRRDAMRSAALAIENWHNSSASQPVSRGSR